MADIVVGGHEGGPGGAPPKPGRRQNEAVPYCDKARRAIVVGFSRVIGEPTREGRRSRHKPAVRTAQWVGVVCASRLVETAVGEPCSSSRNKANSRLDDFMIVFA